MFRNRIGAGLVAAGTVLALAGCATDPIIGRSQLRLLRRGRRRCRR
jgi:hypothetical protein